MKKGNLDRISNLPDSIIHHMFSLMDMKPVVQTSLLSNRWKNLWKSTHILNFCLETCHRNKRIKHRSNFTQFIYNALLLRDASKILKFTLSIHESLEQTDIRTWINAALNRNLEELHLCIPSFLRIEIPDYIFMYKLRVLRLVQCPFPMPLCVAARIKCLILNEVYVPDGDSNGEITLSCPGLESLVVYRLHVRYLEVLNIDTLQLKTFESDSFTYRGMYKYCKINVRCPNLKSIKLEGYSQDYYLLNFTNLTSAELNLHDCGGDKDERDSCASDILAKISNIETLKLRNPFLRTLAEYRYLVKNIPTIFPRLRYLTCIERCPCVVAKFLERLPQVEVLVWARSKNEFGCYCASNKGMEAVFPYDSVLHCLRTVKIHDLFGDEVELKFLESLLNRGTSLKEIVVGNTYWVPEFREKILGFSRVSPDISISFSLSSC